MVECIHLLQFLAATPSQLVKALEKQGLSRVTTTGEWSPEEILAHLIDVEGCYLARLRRVSLEQDPRLALIRPDEATYDRQVNREELLRHFAAARAETLNFVIGLTPADWKRTAIHPSWGKVSLQILVQNLIEHDREHINQITGYLALSSEGEQQ
ncbi:MAG: DinB family protein [Anaerolineales bacterium]|jgi:uncharacterized damage-inducible protein DinB